MKPKTAVKLAVDLLMTVLLFLLMGYQFWGEAAHEWIGAGMIILFIAHHLLNRNWHKNIFKGKYTALRTVTLCVDVLILISMLAQMYSGIVMSRYFDEPAFGAALEHGFGNVSKNGKDKKEFKNPQHQHFYRWFCYCRIWRMGIYKPRFPDLSFFEK